MPAPPPKNTVKFGLLLNDRMIRVSAATSDTLAEVFGSLRQNPDEGEYIPTAITLYNCHFYRMKAPVLFIGPRQDDQFFDEVKAACSQERTREPIGPHVTEVSRLGERLSPNYIYLVIEFPDVSKISEKAVSALRAKHEPLFQCLQIIVKDLTKWSEEDVRNNLQGGVITNDGDHADFRDILHALRKIRTFKTVKKHQRDVDHAREFLDEFKRNFERVVRESPKVTSGREFAAFYNILRSFDRDVNIIRRSSSSYLKASSFTVNFIHPPFFSEADNSRDFQYHPEKKWGFPIFLAPEGSPNAWRKYTPRSDWMVTPLKSVIPLIISVVMSQKSESDRHRMLVQAIAVARAGKHLLGSTSEKRFFVVVVYVNATMVVSRYIVMQTTTDNAEQKPVSIHQEDFDLSKRSRQTDFLREMFNLATEINAFANALNMGDDTITVLKADAKKVLALTTACGKKKMANNAQASTTEEEPGGECGPQDEHDLGLFKAEDIQNILRQMNHKIEFILWGHPNLALIANEHGERRFLKLVKRDNEIQVLKYLSGIVSLANHTISGVQFWPVEAGTLVSMSPGGGWLTLMDHPTKHLWSVALQLFEGVAFMHEHNVAHMDLKPQNIMIPSKGGRVSIIDFSVSIHIQGPDVKYNRFIGTEYYMAPEIKKGGYKPMLADLWSCGRTLEELCLRCSPSEERTKLLDIAGQLMNRDPEARPKMNTLLEWMASSLRGEDNVLPPTFW